MSCVRECHEDELRSAALLDHEFDYGRPDDPDEDDREEDEEEMAEAALYDAAGEEVRIRRARLLKEQLAAEDSKVWFILDDAADTTEALDQLHAMVRMAAQGVSGANIGLQFRVYVDKLIAALSQRELQPVGHSISPALAAERASDGMELERQHTVTGMELSS